jgi:hypothetical protein
MGVCGVGRVLRHAHTSSACGASMMHQNTVSMWYVGVEESSGWPLPLVLVPRDRLQRRKDNR